jgi:membrane protein DedA with SNARE-associated domain
VTDTLLGLVPTYGVGLLLAGTFLACLMLPVPASMLMLAAGGFAAAGDLSLSASAAAALAGATAGDQVGYLLGRSGAAGLGLRPGRGGAMARATEMLARRGGLAVFLSRWLVSALGPYVNLAAGAAAMPWRRFTLWAVTGEAVWVGLYLGLGYQFTGNLATATGAALKLLGLAAAVAVAAGLAVWLARSMRES